MSSPTGSPRSVLSRHTAATSISNSIPGFTRITPAPHLVMADAAPEGPSHTDHSNEDPPAATMASDHSMSARELADPGPMEEGVLAHLREIRTEIQSANAVQGTINSTIIQHTQQMHESMGNLTNQMANMVDAVKVLTTTMDYHMKDFKSSITTLLEQKSNLEDGNPKPPAASQQGTDNVG